MFVFAATIFAYGQTSSGKTYTMRGITENAVKDIYDHIKNVSSCSIPFLLYLFGFMGTIIHRLVNYIMS